MNEPTRVDIVPEGGGLEVTEFAVDPSVPIVVLCGIKYQMSLFKALAEDPFGSVIEIAGRTAGVVGLKRHYPDADGWIQISQKSRTFEDKLDQIERELVLMAREFNADGNYETAARAQCAIIAVENVKGGQVDLEAYDWTPPR